MILKEGHNMIHLYLEDNEYPKQEISETRPIARAVVMDENQNIAILPIDRDDLFGKWQYYELPGGGLQEKEEPLEGAIREIHEEVGVIAEEIVKLGIVEDYYNSIHRKNINHYYLLKVVKKAHRHLEAYEKKMICNVEWVPIEEAIHKFENMPNQGVPILVKQRELPILKEAKRYLTNKTK